MSALPAWLSSYRVNASEHFQCAAAARIEEARMEFACRPRPLNANALAALRWRLAGNTFADLPQQAPSTTEEIPQ